MADSEQMDSQPSLIHTLTITTPDCWEQSESGEPSSALLITSLEPALIADQCSERDIRDALHSESTRHFLEDGRLLQVGRAATLHQKLAILLSLCREGRWK
jgi:hypothetical protein